MRFRTLIVSLTMMFPLVPLFALAQSSSQPTPECQHACSVEYQERIDQCEKKAEQDRNACYEQAALAARTCLAICH